MNRRGRRPPPAGTFRPTAQQLKTFTIASVGRHAFVSEEMTEGKIAVDADRSTPVFSPYSGRVTRVIAGLGDTVKAGAALASIDASEFVQAQNDLSTAAAQVRLARINETRKHALLRCEGRQPAGLAAVADGSDHRRDCAQRGAQPAADSRQIRRGDRRSGACHSASSRWRRCVRRSRASSWTGRSGPGQYLQAGGGTPVFTIADPSSVWLLANVREADPAR